MGPLTAVPTWAITCDPFQYGGSNDERPLPRSASYCDFPECATSAHFDTAALVASQSDWFADCANGDHHLILILNADVPEVSEVP